MDLVRKSVVAKQDISKGAVIDLDMLEIKRPGTGLKPSDIDFVIGKKAKRDISKDEVFEKSMVEELWEK